MHPRNVLRPAAPAVDVETKREELARGIRAELAQAEASLEEARARWRRVETLRAEGVMAEQDVDAARAADRIAEARLEALRTRLSFTRIQSPVSGVVTARHVEVGDLASPRAALLELQKSFRRPPGLVADGRDMGTVVFPAAGVKVFLTASAEERARRRHKQLKEKGLTANLAGLSQEILERDRRDSARSVAPLRPAADALVIDSSGLTIDEVVDRVLGLARGKFPAIR